MDSPTQRIQPDSKQTIEVLAEHENRIIELKVDREERSQLLDRRHDLRVRKSNGSLNAAELIELEALNEVIFK